MATIVSLKSLSWSHFLELAETWGIECRGWTRSHQDFLSSVDWVVVALEKGPVKGARRNLFLLLSLYLRYMLILSVQEGVVTASLSEIYKSILRLVRVGRRVGVRL